MAQLHVICGAAGVGKSNYGKKLEKVLRACFLDSDTVTEQEWWLREWILTIGTLRSIGLSFEMPSTSVCMQLLRRIFPEFPSCSWGHLPARFMRRVGNVT